MDTLIFDIQHFCIHDGPGIRTTVFMKGCPLRCAWCHNPESWKSSQELFFDESKCTLCRSCEAVCPAGVHRFAEGRHYADRAGCTFCGACEEVCIPRAVSIAGREEDTSLVFHEIVRDSVFYRDSGGGATFSGGEPLGQPAALIDMLERCESAGVAAAVETCSHAPTDIYRRVFANAKLMICDLKAGTPRLHELGCGTGNEQILENLNILFRDYKGGIWIRIPCIPGFNDTEREFRVIGKLLSGKRVERVEVTPYHDWGVPKYRALGREYRRLGPGLLERDSLAGLKRTLAEAGVNNIV